MGDACLGRATGSVVKRRSRGSDAAGTCAPTAGPVHRSCHSFPGLRLSVGFRKEPNRLPHWIAAVSQTESRTLTHRRSLNVRGRRRYQLRLGYEPLTVKLLQANLTTALYEAIAFVLSSLIVGGPAPPAASVIARGASWASRSLRLLSRSSRHRCARCPHPRRRPSPVVRRYRSHEQGPWARPCELELQLDRSELGLLVARGVRRRDRDLGLQLLALFECLFHDLGCLRR